MFYKDNFGHSALVGGQKNKARGQLEDCSNSPVSGGSQQEVRKEDHTADVGVSQWQVQAGKSTRTALTELGFVGRTLALVLGFVQSNTDNI